MTNDKILEVIDRYAERLANAPYYHPELIKARDMLPLMRAMVLDGQRDKVFRWLGFVQGVLFCFGVYTIDQMREHNRDGNIEIS